MAPEDTAALLDRLLPDETNRRVVLSALADSIEEANRLQPGGWGVTARGDKDELRLNVGPIQAFVVEKDESIRVAIDEGALLDPIPAGGSLLSGDNETLKEAVDVEIDERKFGAVWTAIRPAHQSLLRLAADGRKNYTWKDAHAPGVLVYLRSLLGRDLPNPAYAESAPAPTGRPSEELVLDRVRQSYEAQFESGKLLSKEKLDDCYRRFADLFGPAALRSLDGTRLLEHIHDHGNRGSLVYWLEFKDDEEFPAVFGSIAGGSALKFGLYRGKESQSWMAREGQGPRPIGEDRAVEIARKHRDQLLVAAETVAGLPASLDDATYAALQRRLVEVAPDVADTAWGHKYLHMLFPEKLDDYHVSDYQRFNLIKLLQCPPATEGRYAAGGRFVALARRLGVPMAHLTTTLNALHGRPYRYWRVGTSDGNEARNRWPPMRDGRVVAIGWPRLGDLSALTHDSDSRDQIKRLLDEHYPNTPQSTGRSAQQIFNFVTTMTENHLVLASDGATVLGVGRVTGPYQFVAGAGFPHQRPVTWLDLNEWKMPEPEGLQTTVHEVRRSAENLVAAESRLWGASTSLITTPTVVQTQPSTANSATTAPPIPRRAPMLDGILGEIQRTLDRKNQVILYGPPGTGKTHWGELAARELASYWGFGRGFDALGEGEKKQVVGPDGAALVRMCCFHPNYGYEDFIEGHRPETATGGTLTFRLGDGLFKKICRDAAKDPERRYYVIIDEINRGDIPRIFGELLTLLEPARRGTTSLVLPLSGEPFTVPKNLYVIGTMNTADRSIALIDLALRRRFGFVELMPRPEVLGNVAIEGIPLGPWLRSLNERIRREIGRDARNLQIGHSYFLHAGKPIVEAAQLRRVLVEDVIPLLEEYCYDDWDKCQRILGSTIVDGAAQRVKRELFDEANEDQLLTALAAIDPSLATSREATAAKAAPVESTMEEDEEEDSGTTAVGS